MPSQLSLFYATSLEISQIASWVRASPENTLSGLPIVNDPGELTLKDDGMALCLYDDTMKMWSTVGDWIPQWREMGQRITEALEKYPTIQTSWDKDVNHLNMGSESLQNFREDMWVEENGSVRPIPSPFILAHNLDEEVKRLEAAYINLPCDEDDDEARRLPYSPLSTVSDSVTTPPLSPCSPFESPDSLFSPFCLPCSPLQTVSPYEIFNPLPQEGDYRANASVMEEHQAPATPTILAQPLPEELVDARAEASPTPSVAPPFPVAGPSTSPLKRPRWSGDESGDETDDFAPQRQKKTRTKKRSKTRTINPASPKVGGKGVDCDLCGKHLGRVTDLPRHMVSCEENPERATRQTPCEICGKLLPVRADAIKRHLASKTCRAKRKKSGDEHPHLPES